MIAVGSVGSGLPPVRGPRSGTERGQTRPVPVKEASMRLRTPSSFGVGLLVAALAIVGLGAAHSADAAAENKPLNKKQLCNPLKKELPKFQEEM